MLLFSFPMSADTVIMVVFGALALLMYWKKGGRQVDSELITRYKERDDLNDKQQQEYRGQINSLTGELGKLRGMLEEKDKRLSILEQIVTNRNPEMIAFMDKLKKHSDEAEAFMLSFKELPAVMLEIKTSLQNLNANSAKKRRS